MDYKVNEQLAASINDALKNAFSIQAYAIKTVMEELTDLIVRSEVVAAKGEIKAQNGFHLVVTVEITGPKEPEGNIEQAIVFESRSPVQYISIPVKIS